MRLLSPRELADALGVSESSLKRWVDAGKIIASRTDGGHRRIAVDEAIRFIRDTGAPVAMPELLGLPEINIAQRRPAVAGDAGLLPYLADGDVMGTRGWLMARYLTGATIPELCDGPIREAMQALGELWRHDSGGIFIEHRASDLCLQALAQLRSLTIAPLDAPLALGGGLEDDPYLLPSFMAAAVVTVAGMRSNNLGPDTPLVALQHAVEAHAPRLVWISVTAPVPPARAKAVSQWLGTLPRSTVAVIGGQRADTLPTPTRVRRVETMAGLLEVAQRAVAA